MYVSFTRWAYEAVICGVFHAGWGPLSRDDIFDEYGYPTSGVALGLYALPLLVFLVLVRLATFPPLRERARTLEVVDDL